MGHTILSIGDSNLFIKDLDLWEIRHFLLRAIEESGQYAELKNYIENWDWMGNGVWDENVEDMLHSGHATALSSLMKFATQIVNKFNGSIPKSYARENLRKRFQVSYLGPVPTNRLLGSRARFEEALNDFATQDQQE